MSQPGVRTLALILCLTACDAGEKPAAPTPEKPAPLKAATAVGGFEAAYLPADSDLVIHIDMTALRKSKLWAPYAQDVAKLIAPGFGGCDYDPLGHVTTVDIGIPIATELGVFVFRELDRDKTLACLRASSTDRTATFDGDFVTLTTNNDAHSVLTFVDAHTMVMQRWKQPTKQSLQQALQLGEDAPLRKHAQFAAVLTKAKKSAAVTIASRPGSQALATKIASAGIHLKYFYGALDLTDRLAVQYAMVVESPLQATEIANMMQPQIQAPQVKQMFDRIEARAQGDTVNIDVAMSEQKLASLWGMVKMMLPAQ